MEDLLKLTKQEQSVLVAQAETYKQYIQGHAYIPQQDLVKYEKAYNTIYGA